MMLEILLPSLKGFSADEVSRASLARRNDLKRRVMGIHRLGQRLVPATSHPRRHLDNELYQ
jgi:hypothetical protein